MSSIRQHKSMAEGRKIEGQSDNFGVEPLSRVNGGRPSPDAGMDHKPLADHERAGPPAVSRGAGKMKAAAQPDHGPHRHGGASGLPK